MSKLLAAWDELLDQAENGDYDEQQDALFQIGLILERHNPAIEGENDLYEESLSRELLRLTLAPSRQTEVLNQLLAWASQDASVADACLYAVSRADVKLMIGHLLEFLHQQGARLKPDAAYQAVTALDICIRSGKQVVIDALATNKPDALLDEWQDDDDDLLADKAMFTLRRMNNLLGDS